MSEILNRIKTIDLKPKVTVKGGSGPIHVVECGIQGTIYDLTFIPVKDMGNVGIGYHSGDSWLVINGLTRMSYLFKKGSYVGFEYFAEKLFPRDYWSMADIGNVYQLYRKIMKEWFGER